jgi:hypothetical protein
MPPAYAEHPLERRLRPLHHLRVLTHPHRLGLRRAPLHLRRLLHRVRMTRTAPTLLALARLRS